MLGFIRCDKIFRKGFDFLRSTNFLVQQRQLNDMEIVFIQVRHLFEIFSLSFQSSFAHWARRSFFLKKQLVDDDVVGVDASLHEFLNQTFCFVKWKEFSYANTNESLKKKNKNNQ